MHFRVFFLRQSRLKSWPRFSEEDYGVEHEHCVFIINTFTCILRVILRHQNRNLTVFLFAPPLNSIWLEFTNYPSRPILEYSLPWSEELLPVPVDQWSCSANVSRYPNGCSQQEIGIQAQVSWRGLIDVGNSAFEHLSNCLGVCIITHDHTKLCHYLVESDWFLDLHIETYHASNDPR